uniref:SAP domain-containing protein n=1 Tax=Chaetoceros debilis TaxID=122233 RepID=A0A7S3V5A2_9STRA|mmetsp:Transcript_19522/g.29550  ORF Transcript_19522/g.29550 Transcript_19522/m.29550 type:complete len:470 (+) Transcript_19522:161-1570(+)
MKLSSKQIILVGCLYLPSCVLSFSVPQRRIADLRLGPNLHQTFGVRKGTVRLLSSSSSTQEEDLISDIRSMRVRQLKDELKSAGVDTSDVFEKEELVQRLAAYRKKNPNVESGNVDSSSSAASEDQTRARRSSTSTPSSSSECRIPMDFHSLTPDASVQAKNDGNIFLRPSPGKYPSININLPNHKRPLTLLVDTACSGIVVRPSIIEQYNLPKYNVGMTMQAAGGTTTGNSVSKIVSPRLDDGTKLDDMMVAGQDIGALPNTLDGIIGISFLNQFKYVAFDFEQGELILRKTSSNNDTTAEMEVLAESDCKVCRIQVWTVDVTLDGRGPVTMLLDTGAASTFINWKGAQDCNMNRDHPLISRNRDALGAMGADNMAFELSHRFVLKGRMNLTSNPSKIGAFEPLGIDITKNGPVNIDIGDLPVLETLKSDNVGGILGSDILMRCDVLELDLSRGAPKIKMLKRNSFDN